MKKPAITLADVAKRAGVSLMTASRSFHEGESASAKSRAKVLKAAKELGYRPNGLARRMKGGRTNVVGLIVNDLTSVVVNEFSAAVVEEVRKYDMDLFIYSTRSGLGHDKGARLGQLLQGLWDGLIFVLPHTSAEFMAALEEEPNPIVLLNYCRPTKLPVVRADNRNGAADAVKHLIDLGHRRIAFIGGSTETGQSLEREQGYLAAMTDAGLTPAPELIRHGNFSERSGLEAAHALLALEQPPTAIFAANDCMAIGCLTGARERGLRIPDDLSVIGFDDIAMAAVLQPGLTTLRHPFAPMAQAAVQELMRRILDQPGLRQTIEFPSEFIIRGTTAGVGGKRQRLRRAV